MDIEKTIPQQVKSYRIDNIKIMLENNKAVVEIWTDNFCDRKEVDTESIIKVTPKTEILVIKNFFNQIIALSLDVNEIDVPDKLFELKEEGVPKEVK